METSMFATQEISLTSKIIAVSEQVSSDLGDELIILDLKGGMYYGLNPVGARVWELIQEPIAVINIRDMILSEYDVDLTRCEGDLFSLLHELQSRGLIEVNNKING